MQHYGHLNATCTRKVLQPCAHPRSPRRAHPLGVAKESIGKDAKGGEHDRTQRSWGDETDCPVFIMYTRSIFAEKPIVGKQTQIPY